MTSKRIFAIAAATVGVIVGAIFTNCSLERINPGHVGVSVRKCGGEGVSKTPIPTGYYWRSIFCESVHEYPTNLRTIVLSMDHEGGEDKQPDRSITVSSSDGLPINIDVSLSFTLDAAKVPYLYQKYRADIDQIASTFLRQTVREGAQKSFANYSAETLYGAKKEVTRSEIQTFLTTQLATDGFVVSQFTVNAIRVPKQVTDAINAKVAMTQEAQRAEAEVQKTRAVAAQVQAQAEGEAAAMKTRAAAEGEAMKLRADAQAYYNRTVAQSLTPAYITYKAQEKWNGALPQVAGGATPFVQLNPVK